MLPIAGLIVIVGSLAGQAPVADAPPVVEPPPAAAPVYMPGTTLYVNASGLAFRRGPSLETERIHYISKGDTVTVLEDNRVPVSFEAEGIRGHWLYVQHGAYKGYVFDGFLSTEPPPLDERIDWTYVPGVRVGPITAQTTYEDLVKTFGKENVREAMVDMGNGDTEPGTAVLPGTADELVIQWAAYRKRARAVQLRGVGSRWKSTDGIAIGTPLSTLVRLNGRPITLAGMGRNSGVAVTSWNGGALETAYPLGPRFGLNLAPTKPYNEDDFLAILGGSALSSDLAAVGRLNLRVAGLYVGLSPATTVSENGRVQAADNAPPLAPGTQFYVLASKLNMRAQPTVGSAVLAAMPYGTRVRTAADSTPRPPLEAEGMHGHWAVIDYAGQRGYVFDAYLSPLPVPRPDCHGLVDYARYSLEPEGGARNGAAGQGVRDYGGGVRLEQPPAANGAEVSLVVPGITLEQAFVLAKRCIPAIAGARFTTTEAGNLHLESGAITVTVAKESGGSVRITESHSAKGVSP